MMNVLIKSSFVIISFLYSFNYFKNNQTSNYKNFIVQDSLIVKNKFFNRVVYFGYKKNEKDTTKWNDIIKIYHIKKKDTILKKEFVFFRQEFESNCVLSNKSIIPNIKVGIFSFIFRTSISNKGNYSENLFKFNPKTKKYIFESRINFMESKLKDKLGLKTTYFINKEVNNIDEMEMKKLFKNEYEIYNGKRFKNCIWVNK